MSLNSKVTWLPLDTTVNRYEKIDEKCFLIDIFADLSIVFIFCSIEGR